MRQNERSLFSERVTLRIVLVSIGVTLLGIVLLYISAQTTWWTNIKIWPGIIETIGDLLVVTGALSLIWELFGKRAFTDEILAKAGLSRDIKFSGIIQVTDSFHTDVDWAGYIRKAEKIDIFFAYGRTWRQSHFQELQAAAQREKVRIRVVLPDPEDAQTVSELARRFTYTEDYLKEYIKEAENYFQKLQPKESDTGGQVEIWYLPAAPTATFYRFDHIGVLALYTHRKERVGVPTFVCEQGGTLYDFIRKEFNALIETNEGLARRVL